jgi:hypothetical protein
VTKRVAGSINTLSNEGASTARDNPRTATPHSDTYPQRAHGQNSSAVRVTTGIRCLDIIRNNPTCIRTTIERYSKIYTTTPTCIRTTSEGYSNTYTTTPTTHATNPRMMNNDLHDNFYDIHDQLPRTIQKPTQHLLRPTATDRATTHTTTPQPLPPRDHDSKKKRTTTTAEIFLRRQECDR